MFITAKQDFKDLKNSALFEFYLEMWTDVTHFSKEKVLQGYSISSETFRCQKKL